MDGIQRDEEGDSIGLLLDLEEDTTHLDGFTYGESSSTPEYTSLGLHYRIKGLLWTDSYTSETVATIKNIEATQEFNIRDMRINRIFNSILKSDSMKLGHHNHVTDTTSIPLEYKKSLRFLYHLSSSYDVYSYSYDDLVVNYEEIHNSSINYGRS